MHRCDWNIEMRTWNEYDYYTTSTLILGCCRSSKNKNIIKMGGDAHMWAQIKQTIKTNARTRRMKFYPDIFFFFGLNLNNSSANIKQSNCIDKQYVLHTTYKQSPLFSSYFGILLSPCPLPFLFNMLSHSLSSYLSLYFLFSLALAPLSLALFRTHSFGEKFHLIFFGFFNRDTVPSHK